MSLKHLFAGTKWDVPCERCGVVLSQCKCPPSPEPAPPAAAGAAPPKGAKRAIVRVEKRPKGKRVTVVFGPAEADLDALAPRLRALCGAGGTVKEGRLEIQGDHREKVRDELVRSGFEAKLG